MVYKTFHPPTPAQLGFRMPAEWEPHRATWLSWPRPGSSSFGGREERVEPILARLIALLLPSEEVHICVWNPEQEFRIRSLLRAESIDPERVQDRLFFHPFPAYEPWIRDHGPIFVVREQEGSREIAIVDWEYNAWGGKYPPWDWDNQVPQRVASYRKIPRFVPGMVLEGGSIDVNGQGTLLTTESCLLHPNRNPALSREAIEARLRDFLGVQQILWLGQGIVGDDTDGHVDDLTRFVAPDTVVTVVEEDPSDPNYAPLQENLQRLRSFRLLDGRPLRILPLPMPRPIYSEGLRMPASYANFYIANKVVILPAYGQPTDQTAREVLQRCFPNRRVVLLDSREIIWGLGSFHCLTQQEPL